MSGEVDQQALPGSDKDSFGLNQTRRVPDDITNAGWGVNDVEDDSPESLDEAVADNT